VWCACYVSRKGDRGRNGAVIGDFNSPHSYLASNDRHWPHLKERYLEAGASRATELSR